MNGLRSMLGVLALVGFAGTKEQLYAIYMIQANEADTRELRLQFRSMVQAALVD